MISRHSYFFFFFFNDTATTEIYTLSLHDALPIFKLDDLRAIKEHPTYVKDAAATMRRRGKIKRDTQLLERSEEHTSELQSPCNLVCRLLLEKKKKNKQHSDT